MSAEANGKTFIKYSTLPEFDNRNQPRNKDWKLIRILAVICIGLVLTILIHEAHYCEKSNNDKTLIENINISIDKDSKDKSAYPEDSTKINNPDEVITNKMAMMDGAKGTGTNCIPGSTKRMDCNTCTCHENEKGTFYGCTKMACVGPSKPVKKDGDKICAPGTTKMQDCNACFCNDEGTGYGCTKMACQGIHINIRNPEDIIGNKE